VLGDDPQLVQIDGHPLGFVLMPYDDSPVRARIPTGSCRGVLPAPLPAGQLLTGLVDWGRILARDTLGNVRDLGRPCDIGAVQSGPVGTRRAAWPLAAPAVDPGPAARRVARPTAPTPRVVSGLAGRLRRLLHDAHRFDQLLRCTTHVGVDQAGDRQHRWGFLYDERDGTGVDRRPALVRAPVRRADAVLLRLSTSQRCLSAAPDPNGSGEDARRGAPTLRRMEQMARRVDRTTKRFDAWESCLSWLPVTEDGDGAQDLGYLTARAGHRPAIGIDRSERDDPDYELLALERRCDTEPGEAVDRIATRYRSATASDRLRALREDVEDLVEPVGDITRFDECMYTVGLQQRAGYLFRNRHGTRTRRTALSFDLGSRHLPQMSVMATSGEEPPQIECNEDAGSGEEDD
jgi:hypothetical protein